MRVVSAAEANREFSKLLAEVKRGESVTITSHGEPVAKLVPYMDEAELARREEARQLLLARLRNQPYLNLGPFKRDDAYDEGDP
ncbi:MAG TPA: type II toxin-antitoxin system prevent-host-death family antitoxin [Microvirga sp.]|jgi:prevent-host-death family protein|nr:type II toxin-antitoxin system prevent-host-death family antitoxin [Microvirga sp.]